MMTGHVPHSLRCAKQKGVGSRKRGFGILEATIALAIVAICSAATIGIVEGYGNAAAKAGHDAHATMLVKNSIQIFEVSASAEEFEDGLYQVTNEIISVDGDWYTISNDYNTVTIFADFSAKTARLSAFAWDSNGVELISVEQYERVNKFYEE